MNRTNYFWPPFPPEVAGGFRFGEIPICKK